MKSRLNKSGGVDTEGIIFKGIGGFYYVKTENGVYETRAAGKFRKKGITPLVGDRAVLSDDGSSITEILPRSCEFIRPPVANINQMIVVFSLASPKVDLRLVDRILFYIEAKEIEPVLCINKCDIDAGGLYEEVCGIYEKAGYSVILTSAKEGRGKDELSKALCGKTTAFAGNSGVGKSSLLNLIEKEFGLPTGEVSQKIERGRHTTRHVELLPLPFGGFVLDTPGFGKIDLPKMEKEKIKLYMREMRDLNDKCMFVGCNHISEKGCAVIHALNESQIAPSRYESYVSFFEELKDYKEWKMRKECKND